MIIVPISFDLIVLALEIELIVEDRGHAVIMPPGIIQRAFQGTPRLVVERIVQCGGFHELAEINLGLGPFPHIVRVMIGLEIKG